jgi:phytoene desaturase
VSSSQLHLATRYPPRAIVIGSGFGGLAAAIRLSVRGYQVTVVEKLDAPGGRAYVFQAGRPPSMPGRRSLPHRSCSRSCGRSAVASSATMSTCGRCSRSSACASMMARPLTTAAIRAHAREVRRLAPDDLEGYERFLKASAKAYRLGYDSWARCRSQI